MPFYTELKRRRKSDSERVRRTVAGLGRLRTAMAAHFADRASVDKHVKSVRIGTWNVREFGGSKQGGRDYEALYYIAEIVSHFDIVALQEVRENLRELRQLLRILGPDWDYLATDVTDGSSGNGERMVFLYNQRKANFRNIAGELSLPSGQKILASFGERLKLGKGANLVLPDGADLSGDYPARTKKSGDKIKLDRDLEIRLPAGAHLELPEGCALTLTKNSVIQRPKSGVARVTIPSPKIASGQYRLRLPGGSLDDSFKQFARTPYIVSFQAGWLKINLCTVHIYFGDNEDPALLEQRRAEIQALTDSLGARASKELRNDPQARTMSGVLGDFNILSKEHETMEALENSGFVVPDEIKEIPGSNVAKDKAYDQIAFWKPDQDRGYAKLDVLGAGVFDFFDHVFRMRDRTVYRPDATPGSYKTWRTYKMSDHLPMWVELRSDFSDEYLAMCAEADE